MTRRAARERGFTLVELLLAMALTALIATSALGALGMFAEADARLMQAGEVETDVVRTLQLLRSDVTAAKTIDVKTRQWTIERTDGQVAIYVITASGTELHRFTGNSLMALLVPVATLLLAVTPDPEYSLRGHLRDASYRATAVLQGVRSITATNVTSPKNGAVIGINVRIVHPSASGGRTTATTAVSLRLAEQSARP